MNPLLLPPRLLLRALDDLHVLALAARDIGPRIDELQNRVDRIDERAGVALVLADRIDEVLGEVRQLRVVAADVALRAGQVAETLPLLERAITLAEPLENTVERVGRLVDRLPGGVRAAGARPPRVPRT